LVTYKILNTSNKEDIKQWNDFARNVESICTIAHNPSLSKVLRKAFNYECENYIFYDEGEVIGIFPLCRFKNKIVSMPHFSYGGPLGSVNLDDFLVESNFSQYFIRSFSKLSKFIDTNKVTCYLPLENSIEKQLSSISPSRRRQIRQSNKHNLILKTGLIDLVDDFYEVYSQNMHYLGSPALSKNFFKSIVKYYEYGSATIFCLYYENKPISASLVISYLGFYEVCWVSTLKKYNYLNANIAIYWHMIRFCVENDGDIFSFGRSSVDSSTLKFKKQWGARVKQIFYNYSEEQKINIMNYKILSRVWSLIPFPIVQFIGPIVSKRMY
jgi:hypothetical protein